MSDPKSEKHLSTSKSNPPQHKGGVLHTYQKYDPQHFPSPTQPAPDFVSPMMEQMLAYGSMRELTEEELARAVKLDPEQFKNMGPSIDMLRQRLLAQKAKILSTYESRTVVELAHRRFHRSAKKGAQPTDDLRANYKKAVAEEQLYELELLYYAVGDDTDSFARHLAGLMTRLAEKYQIDELDSKYDFVGREPMTIPVALEIKEMLEKIDELLKQLEEARDSAQIAILDLDGLSEFMDDETMHSLEEMQRTIENYVKEAAERQGLKKGDNGKFQLTPQAYRVFQGHLLSKIFDNLQASKTGRHTGEIMGEGAVELQQTKQYEFGDSITNMDIPQTFINAMIRTGQGSPLQLKPEDIEIHKTRNNPKCATVVIMDMSGSMRYDGQYINVKRMALAVDGLIRSEYPGDYLNFIEMYTFGKVRKQGEIIDLMPKPVTIHAPYVNLKVDMSRQEVTEHMVHQHFTNIQHSLRLARQLLASKDTPNRQIMLITDGLPTAHFEDSVLHMMYPPHPVTEEATMREGMQCANEGITINMFMVPSWSQSEEDIRFAHRLCESTSGRVFFTSGSNLDRFVVWDYINRKREMIQ
jgi:uncharacterized protein with von Willebrand factor type A (vWA) domain